MPFEGTPSEYINLTISRPETYVFTAFASITLCYSIELIVLTLATFKRYGGVYFWSLLVTSCSLIVNTIGYLLFFFTHVSPYVAVTVIILGWCCMVTGHSVVLWSRLHLVLQNPRLLRAILYLIIFNAVTLHTTTIVLMYGSVSTTTLSAFENGYYIIERIQLVIFCLQELLLSGIYIFETARLLRLRPRRAHKVILLQLLAINVIILLLDLVVVILQYASLYELQVLFKPVAYSIKVRLEYAILGRLVQIVSNRDSIQPVVPVESASAPTTTAMTETDTRPSWPAVESTDSSCRRGEVQAAEGV
jgi:hypothetical protein